MRLQFESKNASWAIWALAAACLSGAVLYGYHDHFWHSRDDGYFAHTADRLLNGEVLHRDIQTPHPGIIHFLHAFSFWLFGADLHALRIFPALATWLQAGVAFYLMRDRGPLAAFAAALAFSTAAFPLFPSPTQHWTCLFLVVILMAVLVEWPGHGWLKLVLLGAICGATIGLRQPSGVFVAMAVSLICFSQAEEASDARDGGLARWFLGRFVMLCFAGILGFYVFTNFDPLSALLFGCTPFVLLLRAAVSLRADNRNVLHMKAFLCAGAILPLSAIAVYHLSHGSLHAWYANSVESALLLNSLDYVGANSYADHLMRAPIAGIMAGTPSSILAGILWPTLLLAAPIVGFLLIWRKEFGQLASKEQTLLTLLVFYILVAGHHPSRVYFFFVLAPILFGLLVVVRPRFQQATSLLVVFIAGSVLYLHGAQPFERGLYGDLIGLRIPTRTPLALERGHLQVSSLEAEQHQKMVRLIQSNSAPSDPILALPGNADFHFLAQRPNPLPAVMPVYSLHDRASLSDAIERLRRSPPKVVIHAPLLPYNTIWTNKVMAHVECDYDRIGKIDGFVVYLLTRPDPFLEGSKCRGEAREGQSVLP